MELEALPEIDSNDIYLECDLMHSPIAQNTNPDTQDIFEQVSFIFI